MNKNSILIFLILVIPLMLFYFLDSTVAKVQSASDNNGMPQIIKFSSSMCRDCQEMDKIMKEVFPPYQDKISYRNILTQERNSEVNKLIKQYNVLVVPTTVFKNKDGKTLYRIEGCVEKNQLKKYMDELINE